MEVVSLQSPGTGRRPSEIIIVKGDSRSTEGDSREFNYFIIAPRSLKLDALVIQWQKKGQFIVCPFSQMAKSVYISPRQ